LKVAKLTNLKLIELSRKFAKEILKEDKTLKNFPKLREKLRKERKIYFV
jgi:hypothetical protein